MLSIAICAFFLFLKNGEVTGQSACPSPSSPLEVTAASGTIDIAPNSFNANCAWRIVAASGTVAMHLSGYMNRASDVVKVFDGYDATADLLYPKFTLSANSISIDLPSSTQRYVYVSYRSTTSYGNYTLTYKTSGTGTGTGTGTGSKSSANPTQSAGGFKWATALLLLLLAQRAVVARFNDAKLA